jgi:hypothetical protein
MEQVRYFADDVHDYLISGARVEQGSSAAGRPAAASGAIRSK